MTGERKPRGGPPPGLAPRPERQRERSREALSRSHRRAEEAPPPPAPPPPDAVSRVGLLEAQPFAVLAYWSAAPRALSAARRRVGDPQAALTLRFQDAPRTPGDAGLSSFDIPVAAEEGSTSVKIEKPFRLLRAELGVVGSDRRFSALARSNFAQTPQDRESEHFEARFQKLREATAPPPPPLEAPSAEAEPAPARVAPPPAGRPPAQPLPAVHEDIHHAYAVSPPRIPAGPSPSHFPSAPLPARALRRNSGSSAPAGASRLPPAILPAAIPARGASAGAGAAWGANQAAPDGPPEGASAVTNYFDADVEVEPWMASDPDGPAAQLGGPPGGGGSNPGDGSGPGRGGAPSPAPTSYGGLSAEAIVTGEAVDLELHADVVIYGRARPGTKVYLSGAELTVKDDGTFEARFALPTPPESFPRLAGGPDRGGNQ